MTETELRELAENEGFYLRNHVPSAGYDNATHEYWIEYPVIVGPDDYDWESEPASDLEDAEAMIKNIIQRRDSLESLYDELKNHGGIDA